MVCANYEVAPEFLARRPQVVLMNENALIEPIFVEMEPFVGMASLVCAVLTSATRSLGPIDI
jgi:hypothetical protein